MAVYTRERWEGMYMYVLVYVCVVVQVFVCARLQKTVSYVCVRVCCVEEST